MKDSSPKPSKSLPWFMQRWFWSILGVVLVIGVFLLVELLLPAYTINSTWKEWVKTTEFRSFIFLRIIIGALIFGMLVYPKVKQTYINKHGI